MARDVVRDAADAVDTGIRQAADAVDRGIHQVADAIDRGLKAIVGVSKPEKPEVVCHCHEVKQK